MKNIKKITSIVLAVVLVLAMSVTAFAAPGSGTPIGDELDQQRYVNEAVANYLEDDEAEWTISTEDPNWIYRTLDDGTIRVNTRGYSSVDEPVIHNITIPSTLDGKTVSEVSGVTDWTTLSITVPDGVTEIGWACFRNISGLKRVVIPASVTSICVNAFDLPDDDGVELYFCGTEEQWNNIVVWTAAASIGGDHNAWAVTNFNWLTNPYSGTNTYLDDQASDIKAVHFNADPNTLDDLVPEEEPEEPLTGWEMIVAGFQNVIVTIVSFFKMLFSWIPA